MIRDQLLGKTNDRKGKEGADDEGDDAADERDAVGGALRVFLYNLGDTVVHLYTLVGPNDAQKYPRPNQHDEDAKKQQKVESQTGACCSGSGHRFSDIWTW